MSDTRSPSPASGGIQFEARAFRDSVRPKPLRFAPPYADRSPNPSGYAYWWQLFRAVFDLPDPNRFPTLGDFRPEDQDVLEQYVEVSAELAESTILSSNGGMSVQGDSPDTMKVIWDLPSKEAIRGTVTLFRQFASPDSGEKIRYLRVRDIIDRRMHQVQGEHHHERREYQKLWKDAHAALNNKLLTVMADQAALRELGAHPDLPIPGDDVRPQKVLSLFQYGEYIHRGRHTDEVRALAQDDFQYNRQTMNFLLVMIQLSHFYLGYSLLVRRALGPPSAR